MANNDVRYPAPDSPDNPRSKENIPRKARGSYKRYVRDCPYRIIDIPSPCEPVPDNYLCNTPDCWNLGARMQDIDWVNLTPKQLDEIAISLCRDHYKVTERIVDAYIRQHSQPDILPLLYV